MINFVISYSIERQNLHSMLHWMVEVDDKYKVKISFLSYHQYFKVFFKNIDAMVDRFELNMWIKYSMYILYKNLNWIRWRVRILSDFKWSPSIYQLKWNMAVHLILMKRKSTFISCFYNRTSKACIRKSSICSNLVPIQKSLCAILIAESTDVRWKST